MALWLSPFRDATSTTAPSGWFYFVEPGALAFQTRILLIHARARVRRFRLRSVDPVAEDPSAVYAMGIHAAPAVVAGPARGNAGDDDDDDAVAWLECGDRAAFVAKNASCCAGRNVAFQDVEIGPADCRLDKSDG